MMHPFMPLPIHEWEQALADTQLVSLTSGEKQARKIVQLFFFPPPDLIINADMNLRIKNVHVWLGSRPGIQWFLSKHPAPLPRRFWKELLTTGFALGSPTPEINGNRKQRLLITLKDFDLDFTDDGILCLKDSAGDKVPFRESPGCSWRDFFIQKENKGVFPGGSLFPEVMWEITWVNFRIDVLRLDSAVYRHPKEGDALTLDARYHRIYEIFFDTPYHGRQSWAYVNPFPSADFGLIDPDLSVRKTYLERFAAVQCEWSYPIGNTLARWKNNRSSVSPAELEMAVYRHFCQCFADHFCALPTVPRGVPTFASYDGV